MSSTKRDRTRRLGRWACYGGMTLIAIFSVVFCWFLYRLAGVWMHDSNLHTFQHTLSPEQREGIIWSAKRLLSPVILLLIITNLGWIAGVGIGLLCKRKCQEQASTSEDA